MTQATQDNFDPQEAFDAFLLTEDYGLQEVEAFYGISIFISEIIRKGSKKSGQQLLVNVMGAGKAFFQSKHLGLDAVKNNPEHEVHMPTFEKLGDVLTRIHEEFVKNKVKMRPDPKTDKMGKVIDKILNNKPDDK